METRGVSTITGPCASRQLSHLHPELEPRAGRNICDFLTIIHGKLDRQEIRFDRKAAAIAGEDVHVVFV